MLCGIVYIPPENLESASECPYNEIESEMQSFAEKFSSIIMFGDFNSRTKCLSDYIEIDEHIFCTTNSEDLLEEYNTELQYFNRPNSCVILQRINSNKGINNYGYKLLDFCKSNSLYILNGRTSIDQNVGNATCKSVSTVDYFLSSPNLFEKIEQFQVHDFCELISDAHCLVSLNFSFQHARLQAHSENATG